MRLRNDELWWKLDEEGVIYRYDDATQQWVRWDEAGQGKKDPKPPPAFFMNFGPEHKKAIVRWLAVSAGEKYSRPFSNEDGQMASMSVFGSESWTDYAQIVLQMMLVDSLATLEVQLERLGNIGEGAPSG